MTASYAATRALAFDRDRVFYLGMAILFTVVAIVSFAPTSYALVAGLVRGEAAPPPIVLHVHAAAMTAWLVLLIAQTYLMSSRRADLHRRLGVVAFALAPVMVLCMIVMAAARADVLAGMPSEVGEVAIARTRQELANLSLINAGSILLFPVFFAAAMLARAHDPETHKRMILLATLALMSPATGRLVGISSVLPDLGLNGADARHAYQALLIAPALVYDVARRGRPHRAYVIGLALMLCYFVAAHFLWNSPAWASLVL